MARILTYDKSEKIVDTGGSGFERRPMPIDGNHIAVVAEMGEPFERKSDGAFVMSIKLDIVQSEAQITLWFDCNRDGSFRNNWKGLGKFHKFCDALNLQEGSYQDSAFIGCALMIEVVSSKGKSGQTYKNVAKMWPCSETENNRAIEWLADRG